MMNLPIKFYAYHIITAWRSQFPIIGNIICDSCEEGNRGPCDSCGVGWFPMGHKASWSRKKIGPNSYSDLMDFALEEYIKELHYIELLDLGAEV